MGSSCSKQQAVVNASLISDGRVPHSQAVGQANADPANLRRAAKIGDSVELEMLLNRLQTNDIRGGAKKNEGVPEEEGHTALHFAATRGSLPCVELLLLYGADVNSRGAGGVTPLHCALQAGRRLVVTLLLEHGAAVNAQDDSGATPLLSVMLAGRKRLATWFLDLRLPLQKGAKSTATDETAAAALSSGGAGGSFEGPTGGVTAGATAEATCALSGTSLAATPAALANAAATAATVIDVGLTDCSGVGPCTAAARYGWWDLLEQLVERARDSQTALNIRSEDGETPLGWALQYGAAGLLAGLPLQGLVEGLLGRGAAWGLQVFEQQIPPLCLAAATGDPSLVRCLLRLPGASLDPLTCRDKLGRNPLHYAAAKGHAPLCSLLIDWGRPTLQPHYRDVGGNTPLHLAAARGHGEAVGMLLERAANPGKVIMAPNQAGVSTYHLVLGAGPGQQAEQDALWVLDRIAPQDAAKHVMQQERVVETPLLLAVRSHMAGVVERLLGLGHDPNQANHRGDSPLARCMRGASPATAAADAAICRMLLERGAVLQQSGSSHPLMSICRTPLSGFANEVVAALTAAPRGVYGNSCGSGGCVVPALQWDRCTDGSKAARGPLHVAALYDNAFMIHYLVETVKMEVDVRSGEGLTPLMYAAWACSLNAIKALLNRGADPRVTDPAGHSVLSYCLRLDRPESLSCAAALVAMGAAPEPCVDVRGEGLLHRAVRYGTSGFIRLWAHYGGDMCQLVTTDPTANDAPEEPPPHLLDPDSVLAKHKNTADASAEASAAAVTAAAAAYTATEVAATAAVAAAIGIGSPQLLTPDVTGSRWAGDYMDRVPCPLEVEEEFEDERAAREAAAAAEVEKAAAAAVAAAAATTATTAAPAAPAAPAGTRALAGTGSSPPLQLQPSVSTAPVLGGVGAGGGGGGGGSASAAAAAAAEQRPPQATLGKLPSLARVRTQALMRAHSDAQDALLLGPIRALVRERAQEIEATLPSSGRAGSLAPLAHIPPALLPTLSSRAPSMSMTTTAAPRLAGLVDPARAQQPIVLAPIVPLPRPSVLTSASLPARKGGREEVVRQEVDRGGDVQQRQYGRVGKLQAAAGSEIEPAEELAAGGPVAEAREEEVTGSSNGGCGSGSGSGGGSSGCDADGSDGGSGNACCSDSDTVDSTSGEGDDGSISADPYFRTSNRYKGFPRYMDEQLVDVEPASQSELLSLADELSGRLRRYWPPAERDEELLRGADLRERNLKFFHLSLTPAEYPLRPGRWRAAEARARLAVQAARLQDPSDPWVITTDSKAASLGGAVGTSSRKNVAADAPSSELLPMPIRPELCSCSALVYAVRLARTSCVAALLSSCLAPLLNLPDGWGLPPVAYAAFMTARDHFSRRSSGSSSSSSGSGGCSIRLAHVYDMLLEKLPQVNFLAAPLPDLAPVGPTAAEAAAAAAEAAATVSAGPAAAAVARQQQQQQQPAPQPPLLSPVALAAVCGDAARLAHLVLRCGADIHNCWTPLPYIPAYLYGCWEAQHAAGADSCCPPLALAVLSGRREMVKLLLDLGADPNAYCEVADPRVKTRLAREVAEAATQEADRAAAAGQAMPGQTQGLLERTNRRSSSKRILAHTDFPTPAAGNTYTHTSDNPTTTTTSRTVSNNNSRNPSSSIHNNSISPPPPPPPPPLLHRPPSLCASPLHLAAGSGQAEVVFLLIRRGALTDGGPAAPYNARSPLQEALSYARTHHTMTNATAKRKNWEKFHTALAALLLHIGGGSNKEISGSNSGSFDKTGDGSSTSSLQHQHPPGSAQQQRLQQPGHAAAVQSLAPAAKHAAQALAHMRARPIAHRDPALWAAHVLLTHGAPYDLYDTQTYIVLRDVMDNGTWGWLLPDGSPSAPASSSVPPSSWLSSSTAIQDLAALAAHHSQQQLLQQQQQQPQQQQQQHADSRGQPCPRQQFAARAEELYLDAGCRVLHQLTSSSGSRTTITNSNRSNLLLLDEQRSYLYEKWRPTAVELVGAALRRHVRGCEVLLREHVAARAEELVEAAKELEGGVVLQEECEEGRAVSASGAAAAAGAHLRARGAGMVGNRATKPHTSFVYPRTLAPATTPTPATTSIPATATAVAATPTPAAAAQQQPLAAASCNRRGCRSCQAAAADRLRAWAAGLAAEEGSWRRMALWGFSGGSFLGVPPPTALGSTTLPPAKSPSSLALQPSPLPSLAVATNGGAVSGGDGSGGCSSSSNGGCEEVSEEELVRLCEAELLQRLGRLHDTLELETALERLQRISSLPVEWHLGRLRAAERDLACLLGVAGEGAGDTAGQRAPK